jgi:hypothetical protein
MLSVALEVLTPVPAMPASVLALGGAVVQFVSVLLNMLAEWKTRMPCCDLR